MKTVFLILIVQLAIGCATKHKLTSRVEQKAERKIIASTDLEIRANSVIACQHIDSLNHQQIFKLYPKGMVSLGSSGFIGEVDSMLWLTNRLHLQKKNFVKEKQIREEVNQHITSTNNSQTKEISNKKSKIEVSFWFVLVTIVLLLGVFWWRIRKQ